MTRLLIIASLILTDISAQTTSPLIDNLNSQLVSRLDNLVLEDAYWRRLSARLERNEIPNDSIDKPFISLNILKLDSAHTNEVRKIFYKYGFPNNDLVGKSGSSNFWLLVQHQDKYPKLQDSILTAMKIEVEKGKASWHDYAYLIDRVKLNLGQLQVYGTQMQLNSKTNKYEPRPTINPETLNDRRKLAGLNTIEEYSDMLNSYYGK